MARIRLNHRPISKAAAASPSDTDSSSDSSSDTSSDSDSKPSDTHPHPNLARQLKRSRWQLDKAKFLRHFDAKAHTSRTFLRQLLAWQQHGDMGFDDAMAAMNEERQGENQRYLPRNNKWSCVIITRTLEKLQGEGKETRVPVQRHQSSKKPAEKLNGPTKQKGKAKADDAEDQQQQTAEVNLDTPRPLAGKRKRTHEDAPLDSIPKPQKVNKVTSSTEEPLTPKRKQANRRKRTLDNDQLDITPTRNKFTKATTSTAKPDSLSSSLSQKPKQAANGSRESTPNRSPVVERPRACASPSADDAPEETLLSMSLDMTEMMGSGILDRSSSPRQKTPGAEEIQHKDDKHHEHHEHHEGHKEHEHHEHHEDHEDHEDDRDDKDDDAAADTVVDHPIDKPSSEDNDQGPVVAATLDGSWDAKSDKTDDASAADTFLPHKWVSASALARAFSIFAPDWCRTLDCTVFTDGKKTGFQQLKLTVGEHHRQAAIPFLINNNHWVLFLLDLKNCQIKYFDSLNSGASIPSAVRQEVGKLAEKLQSGHNVWTFEKVPSPEQPNSDDCGVYVLAASIASWFNNNDGNSNQSIDGLLWRAILRIALLAYNAPLDEQMESKALDEAGYADVAGDLEASIQSNTKQCSLETIHVESLDEASLQQLGSALSTGMKTVIEAYQQNHRGADCAVLPSMLKHSLDNAKDRLPRHQSKVEEELWLYNAVVAVQKNAIEKATTAPSQFAKDQLMALSAAPLKQSAERLEKLRRAEEECASRVRALETAVKAAQALVDRRCRILKDIEELGDKLAARNAQVQAEIKKRKEGVWLQWSSIKSGARL
ncbi:hypothetical protein IWX49DRAFT_585105 [Phyllosticta citricarpa]